MGEQKQTLREFQARLAERLASADTAETASRLGVMIGGRHWLVALTEIHEVVNGAQIVPVPWAKPWFLGLANVRGVVYGCTDMASFLGLDHDFDQGDECLLVVHPRYGVNAALRVGRTLGLRSLVQMQAEAMPDGAPQWTRAQWRDAEGLVWTELDVERLVTDARFLDAGVALNPQRAQE